MTNQTRMNVRNFLCEYTIREVHSFLRGLDENDARREYAEEFLCELTEEFDNAKTDDEWADGDEAIDGTLYR